MCSNCQPKSGTHSQHSSVCVPGNARNFNPSQSGPTDSANSFYNAPQLRLETFRGTDYRAEPLGASQALSLTARLVTWTDESFCRNRAKTMGACFSSDGHCESKGDIATLVLSNLETGEPLWFGRERKKE